jgi:hypothetical protein
MLAPSIISRQDDLMKEIDLGQIPGRVILDLTEEFRVFHEQVAAMREYEHSSDALLEEVLLYIGYRGTVDEGLDALAKDMRTCYASYAGYEDGHIMAEASMVFGRSIFKHCVGCGLYLPNGLLPYTTVQDWIESETVILTPYISDKIKYQVNL